MAKQEVAPAGQAQERRLNRRVGLFGLAMLSLGSVIGSGWLLGALNAASAAGPASIISWILAALCLIPVALVYAELGATYPVAGGTARFTFMASGPLAGFVCGWMSYLQAVTIAPIEVEAAITYLELTVHGLVNPNGTLTGEGIALAAGFMLLFTFLNLMGVRWMAETNSWAMVWKVGIPILTIIVLFTNFHSSNFSAGPFTWTVHGHLNHAPGGFAPYGAPGVLKALPLGVVFALLGFEQAVQMGGEAAHPARDLPIAVISAMAIGVVIYLLLEVVFIGAITPSTISHGWANASSSDYGPYARIAEALGLTWLAIVLKVDAVISPSGTGLVYLASTSRITFSMGRSEGLPGWLGTVSKRRIPIWSVVAAFVIGMLMFLPFPSWHSLVSLVTSATSYMYGFAPVALACLRKADPNSPRPYKLPSEKILAPLAFILTSLIIYWSSWPTDWRLDVGILLGFVIAFAVRRKQPKAERKPLEWKAGAWAFPWIGGLTLLDAIGPSYIASWKQIIPFWWDILIVAVFSLAIFYWAVATTLSTRRVGEYVQMSNEEAAIEEAILGDQAL